MLWTDDELDELDVAAIISKGLQSILYHLLEELKVGIVEEIVEEIVLDDEIDMAVKNQ